MIKIIHRNLLFVSIIIVLFIMNNQLHGAPVVLNKIMKDYSLGQQLEVLEDKKGEWKIKDIISPEISKSFKPSLVETPNFGYTKSIYWVKFSLINNISQTSDWFLEIGYPLIDYIDLYIPKEDGTFLIKHAGDMYNFSKREIQYHKFIFRLSLDSNKLKTLYVRFKTDGTMQLPLKIWSTSSFVQKVNKEIYLFGLFYGIMLVMALYNFFIFITVRDRSYLYYVLYILGFSIFSACTNGFAFEYLWPNLPIIGNYAVPFFLMVSILFALQFARNFLNTAANTPLLNKIIRFFSYIIIIGAVIALPYSYSLSIKIAVIFTVIVIIIIIASGIICLKKKYRPARYFMLAWFVFLCGAILYALRAFGVLPSIFIVEYSHQIGSAIEVVLLSLGLGDRINDERKQKFIAQEKALLNEKLATKAQTEAIESLHRSEMLKDEFLANTSHELRTPLNGIIGIAESLRDGALGGQSEEMKKNLSMISVSGRRLSLLVNDILDFSKLKNKDIKLSLKAVDVRTVSDIVLAISHSLVGVKNIILKNSVENVPPVLADENRLQQMLLNLLGNAVKFTESGIIEISAEFKENSQNAGTVVIKVSDSGIGIPAKQLNKIFDSFEQADGSIERKYGGTGLGLSITRDLAELHNGSIEVISEVGKGSSFIITLPATKEEIGISQRKSLSRVNEVNSSELLYDEKILQESSHNDDLMNDTYTVLAVDDDAINLQVLKNHLTMEKINVLTASSGKEALDIIENNSALDLILLDLMMPGLSGYEVCRIIRERFYYSELPVILLTAKNQSNDLAAGFDSGANDYIVKPFTREELLSRVNFHVKFSENTKKIKSMMEELEELNLKLEDKVEERTEELNSTMEELRAVNDQLIKTQDSLWGEMELAKKIQTVLLPEKPQISGYDISAYMKPASEVGGDYYDVINVEDQDWVIIGDVSGHGVPAGLIMMMVQTSIHTALKQNQNLDPTELLIIVNKAITENIRLLDENRFMTITALATRKDGQFTFAGLHQDIIIYDSKLKEVNSIKTDGMWIGLIDDISEKLQNNTYTLEIGDKMLLFSDGITESWIKGSIENNRNVDSDMFGNKKLENIFLQSGELSTDEIKQEIIKELNYYECNDDITLVVLERLS